MSGSYELKLYNKAYGLFIAVNFIQTGTGLCKEINNFTSALESLDLETSYKDHVEFRTREVQTDYFNDSEEEENVGVFKTREIPTFQLVIQGPEILNFQVQMPYLDYSSLRCIIT